MHACSSACLPAQTSEGQAARQAQSKVVLRAKERTLIINALMNRVSLQLKHRSWTRTPCLGYMDAHRARAERFKAVIRRLRGGGSGMGAICFGAKRRRNFSPLFGIISCIAGERG